MNEDFVTKSEHKMFAELMESENHRLHDEDSRQNERLKNLENMMENFRTVQASMEKMEAIMQSTLTEIEKQGQRLARLESRDGEMWRKSLSHIITTILGIVIGFVFRQIGM